ncbi:MAG: hypothetical protein K2N49_01270, partial [Ruminococcus sp.]|nr:hypothetical protein [Ruminococcus sp.]
YIPNKNLGYAQPGMPPYMSPQIIGYDQSGMPIYGQPPQMMFQQSAIPNHMQGMPAMKMNPPVQGMQKMPNMNDSSAMQSVPPVNQNPEKPKNNNRKISGRSLTADAVQVTKIRTRKIFSEKHVPNRKYRPTRLPILTTAGRSGFSRII